MSAAVEPSASPLAVGHLPPTLKPLVATTLQKGVFLLIEYDQVYCVLQRIGKRRYMLRAGRAS